MSGNFSRRRAIQGLGAAAFSISANGQTASGGTNGLPKLCLEAGAGGLSAGHLDPGGLRRIKQLGVDYVLMGGPRIPWEESEIRSRIDLCKNGGLVLFNMMISGFPNTLYGRPGRDEEIEKVCQSIRAAGRAGLPVIEYNFYAHRAIEGYYEETGRGGAGLTAFDYDRVKNLPPLPEEGAHTIEEMWQNVTYFLKAVIPVAEQAVFAWRCIPTTLPRPSAAVPARSWALLLDGSA